MRLFIFFNSNDDAVHRLQNELLVFSNLIDVQYFDRFEKFSSALRSSFLSETLIIYFVAGEKCLQRAHSIKKILIKMKLLFIFQNNDPALVSQVNDLCPRYYTFASGDLKDVKAVIAKMIYSFEQSNLAGNSSQSPRPVWADGNPNAENSIGDIDR